MISEWSSQSPVEMCNDLKRHVHTRRPKNIFELEQFYEEEWSKVPPGRCAAPCYSYRKSLLDEWIKLSLKRTKSNNNFLPGRKVTENPFDFIKLESKPNIHLY